MNLNNKIINQKTKKIFIDFDGVLVDSNKFKEYSIEKSIKVFEKKKDIQQKSILYFNENAGIGREKKLLEFFNKGKVEKIMSRYSDYCNDFLSNAKLTIGSEEFIYQISNIYPDIQFFILSGAEKNEISKFLKSKKIYSKFQDLLCSEKSKYEHLKSFELTKNDFFIGDSKNDLRISKSFPLTFILVTDFGSDCSIPHKDELDDNIIITKNLSQLLL